MLFRCRVGPVRISNFSRENTGRAGADIYLFIYLFIYVIAIDIDVYSAFAVIFNILCLEVACDSTSLFYWYLHCIYDLILYLCYVLCIIPCVILLVSFMQS